MVKDGNQNRLSLQNKLHNKCKSLIIRGRSDQTDCVDYSQHTRTHINISIYSHSADLLQDECESHGQKYQHPCNSVRKCNPFLRKLLQLEMIWYSRLFIFLHWINKKKKQKKSQIWYNSTQNPKNALDKIIGTLNLIFGSTPFGNQSLPVTMNEFLTPLYWNFGPLFFCKLLQVIQIWRMPSPNCCFEISPQVFYGIQIWTHCWPFQNSPALCL